MRTKVSVIRLMALMPLRVVMEHLESLSLAIGIGARLVYYK